MKDYSYLIGKTYNHLTIIGVNGAPYKVQCECDCPNHTKVEVNYYSLTSNNTKSCGCLARHNLIKRNTKHGLRNHPLYGVWCSMKRRCNVPNSKSYKYYGGRGITYCKEWEEFKPFYDWSIVNGYEKGLEIDRIDNDGNYCPENCRWVTPKVNKNNMSTNVVLEYNGLKMNLKQWSDYLGIKYSTIVDRWERKYPIEKILSKEVRCSVKYVEYNGETKSVHDWAIYFNIKQDTLSARLKKRKYDMYKVVEDFEDMRKYRDN